MNTSKQITTLQVGMKVINKNNPEWGVWTVIRHYHEGIWEIRNHRNETTLFESEAQRFWELA